MKREKNRQPLEKRMKKMKKKKKKGVWWMSEMGGRGLLIIYRGGECHVGRLTGSDPAGRGREGKREKELGGSLRNYTEA